MFHIFWQNNFCGRLTSGAVIQKHQSDKYKYLFLQFQPVCDIEAQNQ